MQYKIKLIILCVFTNSKRNGKLIHDYIVNQLYATTTWEKIVTATSEDIIHPSLMTPQDPAATLRTVEQKIK